MTASSCPAPLPIIQAWPISGSSALPLLQQAASFSPRSAHCPSALRSGSCGPGPRSWISKSSRNGSGQRQNSLPVQSDGHAPRVPSKQHSMPAGAEFLRPPFLESGRSAPSSLRCASDDADAQISYTFILPRAPFDRLLQIANESSKKGAVVKIDASRSSVVVRPGYSGSLDVCIDAVEAFLERMDWKKVASVTETEQEHAAEQQNVGWYAYRGGLTGGLGVENEKNGEELNKGEEEEDAWQAPHYTISP